MPALVLMTAEQLFELSTGQLRAELIDGELREMSPSGAEHVVVAVRLSTRLAMIVYRDQLGEIFGCEGGFVIGRNPDTVLAPDGAFVSSHRIAQTGIPQGYYPGSPDLAFEVISPGDRSKDVEAKALRWVAAGTQIVWVINPRKRTATIYRRGLAPEAIDDQGELPGEQIVPGFLCRLADILP